MPAEKELKKLSKNFVLAIDWAAAEYKYLEELKQELENIKQEKDVQKELKELKKASKILRYVSKAERRAYRFEERVGRELKDILPELEDEHISVELITGFRQLAQQLGLEHDMLVKLASFYDSSLEQELDKAKAEAQLEENLKKEHPEKAAQLHQLFLQLLHQLQQEVGEAEQWIQGLEITLKKAKELLQELPEEGKKHLEEEGYAILKSYGFPIQNYSKSAAFLAQHPADLREMAQAAGGYAWDLFGYGLPACAKGGLLKPEYWERVVNGLVKMTQAVGGYAWVLFGYGLPACAQAGLLKPEHWDGLVKMAQAAGESAGDIFREVLPACAKAGLLKPEYWDELTKFLIYIAQSTYQMKRMVQLFNRLNPKSLPFLLFLIQNKPKLVLDILEKYHLLELLEINFRQELELFLKIAAPITLKEKDFRALKTISLPFKVLPSGTRNFFLKSLNLALRTFQGVQLDFLKSLEATAGFGDVNQYSFVELVYVYLKYAQNPEIKLEKLQKSISKIQKEEQKILGLMADKNNFAGLNEMEQLKLKAGLKGIGELFFEPLLYLYTESTEERLEKHLEQLFKVKIKDIKGKFTNESLPNALKLLKRLEQNDRLLHRLCFTLIQNYLTSNTYSLTKNILECYPWNLPENQAWLKSHIQNKWWYEDFREECRTGTEAIRETNVEERIRHHLQEAQRLIAQLNFQIDELNLENIEAVYKKIAGERSKYNEALVSDLKTQISALKTLKGEEMAGQKTGQKIIIQPELDPLEVLQMGNYVQGSCLSVDGANFWSAVVNATEVNKRVLWAKDASGVVLARVLIAVDDNNNLVRFPTYYATNFKLDTLFDKYILELAEKCGFGTKGKVSRVKKLLSDRWYTDREVDVK